MNKFLFGLIVITSILAMIHFSVVSAACTTQEKDNCIIGCQTFPNCTTGKCKELSNGSTTCTCSPAGCSS